MEQLNFNINMDKWEYDSEISLVEKELRKDLFSKVLNYNINKESLKDWFVNKFFLNQFVDNVSCEDLYYVAEEKCNIKLIN